MIQYFDEKWVNMIMENVWWWWNDDVDDDNDKKIWWVKYDEKQVNIFLNHTNDLVEM